MPAHGAYSLNSFFGYRDGVNNESRQLNTAVGAETSFGSTSLTNATDIGFRAQVAQDDSLVLGSINGVNGATDDTNVGIGTTAPSARLHVARGPGLFSEDRGELSSAAIGTRWRDNSIIAWGAVNADGSINRKFNVDSITRAGGGAYTIILPVSASTTGSLVPLAIAEVEQPPTSATAARLVTINQVEASQFRVYITNGNYAAVDNQFTFIVTGH